MRLILLAMVCGLLVVSGPPAAAQDEQADDYVPLPEALGPIPEALVPYIHDGRYDPGDFGWMRGRFDGASEAEKSAYQQTRNWLDQCFDLGNRKVERELAEMGFADVKATDYWGAATLCVVVSAQPDIKLYEDFADFSAALAETQPIYDTLFQSIFLAERIGGAKTDATADQLLYRPLRDQMLRGASSWSWVDDEHVRPKLTDRQKPIFAALVRSELMRADARNTQWLKSIVSESGWPTISQVGKDASQKAWLLVQHADQDPVFQLKILRLLEPLVAQGEVRPVDYAYLYDRVMLKLRGKQRYATQMWCMDGKMEARPLEDPERVAELRAEMTLEPFAEYRKYFPETC